MMARRVYVSVIAEHDEEGGVRPLEIRWEDGRKFPVTRILDVRRAAATKAGGQGIRYTCKIGRAEAYLFEDRGRWFVESKNPQIDFSH